MAGSSQKMATEGAEQKPAERDASSQQPKASGISKLQEIQAQRTITNDRMRAVGICKKGLSHLPLQYLKKVTKVEMRRGLKDEGNAQFVLVSRESVSQCKWFGNYLIISNYDDNKTRFFFQDTANLPIAVNTTEDAVGILDHEYGTEFDIAIDFYDLTDSDTPNDGSVLARYEIRFREDNVGEIIIKPGQVTFMFSDEVLVEHKAISIAYGVNRALNIHIADVVQAAQQPRLYAEGLLSLYENIFPQLEIGVLRATSKSADERKYQFVLMDFNNQNKIAMIVNCDRASKLCTAFDLRGNQLFQAIELAGPANVMHVSQETRSIGKCTWVQAKDTAVQLKLSNGEAFKLDVMPGFVKQYVVVDSHNEVVSRISDIENRPRKTVKIRFLRDLEANAKKVILSLAIKLAFKVFQLHQHCVPIIKLSKIVDFKDQVSPTSPPSNFSGAKVHPKPAALSYKSLGWRNYTFRAAGYSIVSGTQYYDVISDDYEVYMTMECQPPSQTCEYGMLRAKNEQGLIFFEVPDFQKKNMMTLYNETGQLMGYQQEEKFYAPSHDAVMSVGEELHRTKPNDHIHVFTLKGQARAHIFESDFNLTLSVLTTRDTPNFARFLMVAYAVKLCYTLNFGKLSIPQIEYKYCGQNADIKEY